MHDSCLQVFEGSRTAETRFIVWSQMEEPEQQVGCTEFISVWCQEKFFLKGNGQLRGMVSFPSMLALSRGWMTSTYLICYNENFFQGQVGLDVLRIAFHISNSVVFLKSLFGTDCV